MPAHILQGIVRLLRKLYAHLKRLLAVRVVHKLHIMDSHYITEGIYTAV